MGFAPNDPAGGVLGQSCPDYPDVRWEEVWDGMTRGTIYLRTFRGGRVELKFRGVGLWGWCVVAREVGGWVPGGELFIWSIRRGHPGVCISRFGQS